MSDDCDHDEHTHRYMATAAETAADADLVVAIRMDPGIEGVDLQAAEMFFLPRPGSTVSIQLVVQAMRKAADQIEEGAAQ
ncbi:hypothetical protein [Tomitella fengzijianii]|uniref:Uncharacterized protein n=1 Tax=Tomitella fengzijianii TaxID=2597660 RepID=A0A516X4M1_9ACTN|nr:hypothetical protein [Tomitella fengzijianii]QDQ97953.1 hypothetical protein FO059_12315 [Tomitella fengzijianii]